MTGGAVERFSSSPQRRSSSSIVAAWVSERSRAPSRRTRPVQRARRSSISAARAVPSTSSSAARLADSSAEPQRFSSPSRSCARARAASADSSVAAMRRSCSSSSDCRATARSSPRSALAVASTSCAKRPSARSSEDCRSIWSARTVSWVVPSCSTSARSRARRIEGFEASREPVDDRGLTEEPAPLSAWACAARRCQESSSSSKAATSRPPRALRGARSTSPRALFERRRDSLVRVECLVQSEHLAGLIGQLRLERRLRTIEVPDDTGDASSMVT